MILKLQSHLLQNFPFLKEKKLLLAVSGGLDSIVMLQLFRELQYHITIAHCNFNLRGEESDDDQKFVEQYALDHNIPIHITRFDTEAFAAEHQMSIQIAARELRYSWFHQLLEQQFLDYILTAHHADDAIETFLINMTRGTGLEGLIGIPKQNGKIIRPLLPFSREELHQYILQTHTEWREDSSNASDKYMRNRLRHHVVPILKALNPNFLESFQQTFSNLQESQIMAEDAVIHIYKQVAEEKGDQIWFNLEKIRQLSNSSAYLYKMLREYGFTSWKDIRHSIDAQSGKQFFSHTHRLVKDRSFLILEKKKETDSGKYTIDENQFLHYPLNIELTTVTNVTKTEDHFTIFVDKEKLKFPLILRKWKEGDYFYPFGMKGQKKKLSKYFKDEKLSLIEKEENWLLCSEDQIVWVVGKRMDNRFKVTKSTKLIYQIKLT